MEKVKEVGNQASSLARLGDTWCEERILQFMPTRQDDLMQIVPRRIPTAAAFSRAARPPQRILTPMLFHTIHDAIMPATLSYRTHTLVAWRAVVEATGTIDGLLLCDGDDVDVDAVEAHGLEQVLGLLVDVELAALRVLREVEGGHFGHVLILALALLFLQLEGDTAHWATLDTLHQVGGEACDLSCGMC